MAINAAFAPLGNMITIAAAVAGSAPAPVQLLTFTPEAAQVDLDNIHTAAIFFVYAKDSATAAALAAAGIPAAAGSPNGSAGMICIPAGTNKVRTIPPGSWVTAIVAASTGNLQVTPGDGKQ